MNRKPKILEVCAVGETARFLLGPLFARLMKCGFEVHVACSAGSHGEAVRKLGVVLHEVPIARRVAAPSHAIALAMLYRLMRTEEYEIVHVHTPVAAALGRVAARAARVPVVVYTAHGFYFHDRMPKWKRQLSVSFERILGCLCTDWLFVQSGEDLETAVRERIVPQDRAVWIGNGVDVSSFGGVPVEKLRASLGIENHHRVVGFVGRVVREKGILELIDAMRAVVDRFSDAVLLVVGNTLTGERDRRTRRIVQQRLAQQCLGKSVLFTGFREDATQLFSLMDVFVLPSHREGMPRSILEAMASKTPVVATDIRGCREEVIHGETGYLVPVEDVEELADAIVRVLLDRENAQALGKAGYQRAREHFDESDVLDRQLAVLVGALRDRGKL